LTLAAGADSKEQHRRVVRVPPALHTFQQRRIVRKAVVNEQKHNDVRFYLFIVFLDEWKLIGLSGASITHGYDVVLSLVELAPQGVSQKRLQLLLSSH